MTLKKKLTDLVNVISKESEKNPEFKEQIEKALGVGEKITKRRGGRRDPAVLDPVELVRTAGEEHLRCRLAKLSLEQLRDIVAQYDMGQGGAVAKWQDSSRVIDRIVEIATARAKKGDAFKGD